jgi:hypothetical protein
MPAGIQQKFQPVPIRELKLLFSRGDFFFYRLRAVFLQGKPGKSDKENIHFNSGQANCIQIDNKP